MPPLPTDELARSLDEQWSRSAAQVRPAPVSDVQAAADLHVNLLKGLTEERAKLDELTAFVRDSTRSIFEAETYFAEDVRDGLRRLGRLSREWADRWGSVEIPEMHPFAIGLGAWVRPYNASLRRLQLALLDVANGIAHRLAEEAAEDAAAREWAEQNPPAKLDDADVSLDDFERSIGGG